MFINVNGKYYKQTEPVFTVENRAFKYGDAIFETIRVINGKCMFIEDHFKRLKQGMSVLKMKSSKLSFSDIQQQIQDLLGKNKIKQGGRVRLTVFRKAEGFYIPTNESKAYLIEAIPLENNLYTLNSKGLTVDVFKELPRVKTKLSALKTANSLPLVLAGIYKQENDLDDCLIINNHNRIIEAIYSNFFLYKNRSLYTPAIDEGCVDGIMRKKILELAREMNLNVFEGMINGSMLLQADELFLTNAIKGIQWVETYRQKTYKNEATTEILSRLNTSISSS